MPIGPIWYRLVVHHVLCVTTPMCHSRELLCMGLGLGLQRDPSVSQARCVTVEDLTEDVTEVMTEDMTNGVTEDVTEGMTEDVTEDVT